MQYINMESIKSSINSNILKEVIEIFIPRERRLDIMDLLDNIYKATASGSYKEMPRPVKDAMKGGIATREITCKK